MTARTTPPGSLYTVTAASLTGVTAPAGGALGKGSTTGVKAVPAYTPPVTGQLWPRPY